MTVLPAFLEIFVPVAVAFLVLGLLLGWIGHAWRVRHRGHARRCPARQPVTDREWEAVVRAIKGDSK